MRRILLAVLTSIAVVAGACGAAPDATASGACADKNAVRGAAPAGGSAVVQICIAGRRTNAVSGVDVVDPAGVEDPAARVGVGRVFAVRTSIGSPAGTIIDVQSPQGVVARIYGGARLRILAESDRAEAYRSERGRIGFDVPKNRLDFMNVVTESLFALVKGTTFDVDSDPGKTASIAVDDGTVAVTHPVRVHLVAENRTIDCVRITEFVKSGEHFNVAYPDQEYRSFPDAQSARSYFDRQFDDAFAAHDATLAQQALDDTSLVDGNATTPVAAQPPLYKHDLPAKAGLAAAVGFAIGYFVSQGKTTLVTVGRPAVASPSPSPSPKLPAATAPVAPPAVAPPAVRSTHAPGAAAN